MRIRTRLGASVMALAASACGGSGGSSEPEVQVAVASPADDVIVSRGGSTSVSFTCEGVDAPATTRLVADADGDASTLGDQYEIAAGLPETGPTAQAIPWDTTGVPVGDYHVIAFADDGVRPTATATSAGKVSVSNVAYAGQASVRTFGLAALPDGSTIVCGVFTGTATLGTGPAETTLAAAGGAFDADVCLARFAPGGTLAWARRAGGVDPDRCDAIGAAGDGSFSVAGMFRTSATYGPGEPHETTLTGGLFDLYVASYTGDGSLLWAKRIVVNGPTGLGFVTSVARYDDGACVVAGTLHGSVVFGSGEPGETTLASSGTLDDAFAAKFGSDGHLVWARSFGSPFLDLAMGVTTAADGGAVVTGGCRGDTTFGAGESEETTISTTTLAMFVASFSPSGSLAWVRRATEAVAGSTAIGTRIATAPDGYLVLGSAVGSTTFDPGTAWETPLVADSAMGDAFVAKYGLDGTLAWARRVETGAGLPGALGVSALADGGYAVGGIVTGTTTIGPDAALPEVISSLPLTAADVYVARFDPDGAIRWVWTAGGASVEAFTGLDFFPDGSVAVTGSFKSTATFGEDDPHETQLTTAATGGEAFVACLNGDGGF